MTEEYSHWTTFDEHCWTYYGVWSTVLLTELTQTQKAQIYCVKHSHANYVTNCMGYKSCGRCNTQIGDTLAGCFDMSKVISVGHKCDKCNELKKSLPPLDVTILDRLENSKDSFPDHEEILKGLNLDD